MRRALVTGAGGQLGQELAFTQPAGWQVDFVGHRELDITDAAAVQARVARGYEVVINAAAYTQVDKAESEPELAFAVNAAGVGHLAQACVKGDCLLVQISTDYVFDGKSPRPYLESDPVQPLGVYGNSKLAGEQAMAGLSRGVILRTSWLYSTVGINFVKTMLRLAKERKEIKVVQDQWGSPTYANDLATGIWRLLERPGENLEIFHFSNPGITTWFEFAQKILSQAGWQGDLIPITTQEYGAKAPRPAYSVLNTQKYQSHFGEIPPGADALQRALRKLL